MGVYLGFFLAVHVRAEPEVYTRLGVCAFDIQEVPRGQGLPKYSEVITVMLMLVEANFCIGDTYVSHMYRIIDRLCKREGGAQLIITLNLTSTLQQDLTTAGLGFDIRKYCGVCNVGNGRALLDDQELHGKALLPSPTYRVGECSSIFSEI